MFEAQYQLLMSPMNQVKSDCLIEIQLRPNFLNNYSQTQRPNCLEIQP